MTRRRYLGALIAIALLGSLVTIWSPSAAAQEAAITLEKRVLLGFEADCSTAVEGVNEGVKGRLGDDVTWCFTAINTGSVALRVTEIIDETLDVALAIPEADQILPVDGPQSSVTVKLNGTINRDPVVNIASVEGRPVDVITGALLIDPATNEPFPPVTDTNSAIIAPILANLRIANATSSPDAVVSRGSIVAYELEVENQGPDTALDVEVINVLAPGLEFVALPDVENWSCFMNEARSEFFCATQRLRIGRTPTIPYEIRVQQDAPFDVTLSTVAAIDFAGTDPQPDDNMDTASLVVTGPPRGFAGDINCDRQLGIADVLAIAQVERNMVVPVANCSLATAADKVVLASGDVDLDGLTNLTDARQVLECLVGTPNSFCPAAGEN